MPDKNSPSARQQLLAATLRMADSGLNKGTAGNLSVRTVENHEHGFLITPTGMAYDTLEADDVVFMRLDGDFSGVSTNKRKPSSEWRFHRDIYAARPEAQSILHAHSPFATSLACLRREIPRVADAMAQALTAAGNSAGGFSIL